MSGFTQFPIRNPKPNGAEFIDIIMGRSGSTRVPLVEYIVDETVMRPVVTDVLGRSWVAGEERANREKFLDNFIAFWYGMGYDCVRIEIGYPFVENRTSIADAAPGANKDRAWSNEHEGVIQNWDDFEKYTWPKLSDVDFSIMEYVNGHLPDGMGLISCHGGGVFEHLSSIMSIEGLCYALYEQPDLVQAVADKVGESLHAYHEALLGLERIVAIFQGDDMGFRTGTLIGPNEMRMYSLSWHKKLAALAHSHGKPYFLHSCGNLTSIIEDLIDDVGIDAKHSYEDAIIPVQDFQAKYGKRIGVLGGIDINILSGGTPEEVRAHTRYLVETCGARGRYAIGSGNSVPSYVPVGHYLTMVDEALSLGAAAR